MDRVLTWSLLQEKKHVDKPSNRLAGFLALDTQVCRRPGRNGPRSHKKVCTRNTTGRQFSHCGYQGRRAPPTAEAPSSAHSPARGASSADASPPAGAEFVDLS